jgi:hypothetical protein
MANIPDKLALPPIEKMVIKGVESQLATMFDIEPSQVVFVASTDRMVIADRITKMHNGAGATIKWPLLFLRMTNASSGAIEQAHAVSAKSFSRHGVYIKLSDGSDTVQRVSLLPALFEIEVIYMVDEFFKAFKFTSDWLTAANSNRMNFTLTYGNVGIDIRCIMADSLTTPDKENSVSQASQFEYTTTVKVAGYITDSSASGSGEVAMVRRAVTTVSVGDPKSPPQDDAVYSASRQRPDSTVLNIPRQ